LVRLALFAGPFSPYDCAVGVRTSLTAFGGAGRVGAGVFSIPVAGEFPFATLKAMIVLPV
jgi:hypothetical protein